MGSQKVNMYAQTTILTGSVHMASTLRNKNPNLLGNINLFNATGSSLVPELLQYLKAYVERKKVSRLKE